MSLRKNKFYLKFSIPLISACLGVQGAQAMEKEQDVYSPTLKDLTILATHVGAKNLEKNLPVSTILTRIEVEIKKNSPNEMPIIESLKQGEKHLETIVALEQLANENGYTLWWRYTNGIDGDISKNKPKSIGRTLLAGFLNDGVGYYKSGVLGFDTACVFSYLENAHFFKHHYFPEALNFLDELNNFIDKNQFHVKSQSLGTIKDYFESSIAKQKEGIDINFDDVAVFCRTMQSEIADIIIKIQYDANYKTQDHKNTFDQLYGWKNKIFCFSLGSYIKNPLEGHLVALPLTIAEEEALLKERNNLFVYNLDHSPHGRGEYFHPRLTTQQLIHYKDRLIPVYSHGQLHDWEQIRENLKNTIQTIVVPVANNLFETENPSENTIINENIKALEVFGFCAEELKSKCYNDPLAKKLHGYVFNNMLHNTFNAPHFLGVYHYVMENYEEARAWLNYPADMGYAPSQLFLNEMNKKNQ